MNPGFRSHPSPAHDGWLFEAHVSPSTLPDEYPNPSCGAGPPNDGGTRNGYDVMNSPDDPPARHDSDGANDVCEKSPDDDEESAVNATTVGLDVGSASAAEVGCRGT